MRQRLQCLCSALVLLVVGALTFVPPQPAAAQVAGNNCTRPVIFNFGDSNSDTGGYAAAVGWHPPVPIGGTFFHYPTGRLSDGRLIIDYFCESLKTRYLSPYLKALGSDYSNGVDFAISGSTILERNDVCFPLDRQVRQFAYFWKRSFDVINQGLQPPIALEGFQNAVYTIDIGHNDLTNPNLTYDRLLSKIPEFVAGIKNAVETLNKIGARKFWIHGTGALGCLPDVIRRPRKDDSDLDENGCLKSLNSLAMAFNAQLSALCDQLKDVTIVYTDLFAIKYDLVANHTNYGFTSTSGESCTSNVAHAPMCEDPNKFISWDGVHFTDAANAVVAAKILTGEFSKPKIKFASLFDQVCKV